MEINIISVESSFSLFLDSTFLGNGSCLANCGDTSTFSVQVFHVEEIFVKGWLLGKPLLSQNHFHFSFF